MHNLKCLKSAQGDHHPCAKFRQNRSRIVEVYKEQTNRHTLFLYR
jgi:hypothetical protein